MFVRSITTVALLSLPFLTGCPMSHGDPKNPRENPHPIKRYEITATADAPGPWDSVKGYIGYDVVNLECTRENKFLGVHIQPQDVGLYVEMIRVGEKTWKGYFYRDYLLDENYYGLGICHWDVTSVTAGFTARGVHFPASRLLKSLLEKGPQASYFKKSVYGDRSFASYGAMAFSPADPDVIQHADAYFPITVIVKEATP